MAMASERFAAPSFEQIAARCCFTASTDMLSIVAMSLFVRPRAAEGFFWAGEGEVAGARFGAYCNLSQ